MTYHSLGLTDARITPYDLELCRGVPTGRDARGWLTWQTVCINLSDPSTLGEFKSLFYDATHYGLSPGQSWTEADNLALYQWALDTSLEHVHSGPDGVLGVTRLGLATLLTKQCYQGATYNTECDARYPWLSKLLVHSGKNLAFFPPKLGATQPMPPSPAPPPGGPEEGTSLATMAGYAGLGVVCLWGAWRLLAKPRR